VLAAASVAAADGGKAAAAASLASCYRHVGSAPSAHAGDVNCVRWHPRDPGLLFSAGDDHVVRVWRLIGTGGSSASGGTGGGGGGPVGAARVR
jgi:WD40 repeat protein